jgi:hypothetical protein
MALSIAEFVAPEFIKDALSKLDISLTTLRDALRGAGSRTLTDIYNVGNSVLSKLDVALSTRASETTLSGIKTQTDKLTFDANNYLQVNVRATVNPPNLDVALSTRASETTLSGFSGKFPSAASLADNLSNPSTTIIGSALLGFDGTYWRRIRADTNGYLLVTANIDKARIWDGTNYLQINADGSINVVNPNLNVALSTRASESTLSGLSGKFPTAVALGDNLSNPTTTIVGSALLGWDGTYWRRIAADTSSRLKVALDSIPNPPNLDVALSTRASESTLSSFSGKFPSASALGDSMSNPTTTVIGGANLVWNGTNWSRLGGLQADFIGSTLYGVGTIPQWLPSRQAYLIDNVNVTTTEGSTTISAPGAKILIIKNKGDVDALIGLNASVPATNPLIVRARTVRVIVHRGVTAVYYKTSTGSTTLEIAYYN